MLNNKEYKIKEIEEVIFKYLPGSRLILFGSRASGNYDEKSDYDVLSITPEKIDAIEIRLIKSKIRTALAKMFIPIDIIIISESEVKQKTEITNHIINEALSKGVVL